MALVHLLSAASQAERTAYNLAALRSLQRSARLDRFGVHQLSDDAAAADLILFAELYGAGLHFEAIRRHPLVKRYRDKCFLFCSHAFVIPFLPGVYSSIEKQYASNRARAGFHVPELQNEFTSFAPPTDDLPYLFSFMGSTANAPVRRAIGRLHHARMFFRDTRSEFERVLRGRMNTREQRDYHRQYVEVTKASRFVLCPRGLGTATIRLFETMRMGRVPVILSDQWLAPAGPDWDACSVRLAEADVAQIPSLLERLEEKALEMGLRAHREWSDWFSDEVAFHRVVEECLAIKRERRLPEAIARWPTYLQLLRPVHLKYSVRPLTRRVRRLLGSRAAALS